MRALGNTVHDPNFVGLVLGTRQNDRWLVVVTYIKEGYIKDDAAKDWNADDLLKNLKEGVDESNKDRAARGFPEMEVIGWIEPPNYDATAHRLVWSVLGKDKGAPDNASKDVNYNTYALGRDGYFSLNLLSDSARIATDKSAAHELLANLSYQSGKRYEDFSASTDRIAEYGLLALVGGVAAKKLGLLALALAFVLKFAKVIFVGAAVFGTGMVKFFRRKPRDDSAGGVSVKTLFLLLFSGLKWGKLATSGGSMLLSLAVYASIWGWRYAAGFIALLFAHEIGHYVAARQRGLDVGAPAFIPFVGAWIALKDKPVDVETEAYIAIAGPVVGTVAALAVYLWARSEDSGLLLAISYAGLFLNLFNLLPISPLDGGRVTAVLSPRIWLSACRSWSR